MRYYASPEKHLYPGLALDIKSKTGYAPSEFTGEFSACSIGPPCIYQNRGQFDYKPHSQAIRSDVPERAYSNGLIWAP